ncbi:MAG: HD domain-containing protein [Thomasclavelia sp.]|nr:HD domain-containing protein [Thomasclavelia sp.]
MKVNKVLKEVIKRLDQSFYKEEGYQHLIGTATLMAEHCDNLDKELCYCIGLLHDISFYVTGINENHACDSALMAKEILIQIEDFNDNEITIITNAIKNHSQKDIKSNDEYSELIKKYDLYIKRNVC